MTVPFWLVEIVNLGFNAPI